MNRMRRELISIVLLGTPLLAALVAAIVCGMLGLSPYVGAIITVIVFATVGRIMFRIGDRVFPRTRNRTRWIGRV